MEKKITKTMSKKDSIKKENETYWTLFSTNKGINLSTVQKALPIDEVIFGALGRGVYNYIDQLKNNSKDKSEEELIKIMSELKDVLYFKFKTLLLNVFVNMFGAFDDIDYTKYLIKKEQEMLKAFEKQAKEKAKTIKKEPTK